jgi:hypothetical protein
MVLGWSAPAAAAVALGAITGGGAFASGGTFIPVNPIPAGFTVGNNPFSNFNLYAFNEQQSLTLLSDLKLFSIDRPVDTGVGKPFTITAGTTLDSHGVQFDPVNATGIGFVTFDRPVIAVIRRTPTLNSTNALLGNAAVNYQNVNASGLELNEDFLTISGNTVFFNFKTSSPGDNFRVLTSGPVTDFGAIPEPGTWALFIAGFGLIGLASRRRTANTSVVA